MKKIIERLDTELVIKVLGSSRALAKVTSVQPSQVVRWRTYGWIHEAHTKTLEKALKARKREFDRLYKQVMK